MISEQERAYGLGWDAGMDAYRQRLLAKLQPHIKRQNGEVFLALEWKDLLAILRSIG